MTLLEANLYRAINEKLDKYYRMSIDDFIIKEESIDIYLRSIVDGKLPIGRYFDLLETMRVSPCRWYDKFMNHPDRFNGYKRFNLGLRFKNELMKDVEYQWPMNPLRLLDAAQFKDYRPKSPSDVIKSIGRLEMPIGAFQNIVQALGMPTDSFWQLIERIKVELNEIERN